MFKLTLSTAAIAALLVSMTPVQAAAPVVQGAETVTDWYNAGNQFIADAKKLAPNTRRAKNVIFFVGDGMGISTQTAARILEGQQRGQPGEENRLAFETFPYSALSKTYAWDQQTPDSAPTMTALITGYKTREGMLSVNHLTPRNACDARVVAAHAVPSLLEMAAARGKATGIVSTARLTHATPGATYAHTAARDWESDAEVAAACPGHATPVKDIARQLIAAPPAVRHNLKVALGGGRSMFMPRGVADPEYAARTGRRLDGRDLTAEWVQTRGPGARYIWNRAGFDALDVRHTGPVLGLFEPSHMQYEADRPTDPAGEPSLAEMTRKAIEVLSRSDKGRRHGFFLFVEGSKVDWAAHANDPSGVVSDLGAYDEAVKVALDFARADGQTLVISTSDHGNGGLTIGRREATKYATTDDDSLVTPLRRAQLTGEGLARLMAQDKSEAHIRNVLARHWGIEDLSAQEVQSIQNAPPQSWLQYVLGPMISSRAGLGWTTNGHTGGDPFLYSYGPGRISGLWENTDLAHHMANAMGFDLTALRERLFVEAMPALTALGLQAELDRSQAANPVLRVRNNLGGEVRLPIHKNELVVPDRTHELEGVVVLAEPTGKVYVPRQAITLIRASLLP